LGINYDPAKRRVFFWRNAMQLPNGSAIAIASTLGAPITATAISNANPGVVSAAAHGLSDGDIIVVSSGWELLNGRVVRVDDSATGVFDLEGINTVDTDDYPAGGGVGTVREVTAWTEITDVINPSTSGGEQQFWTYQTLRQKRQRQLPTVSSPIVIAFQAADDVTQPWYAAVLAAAKAGTPTPMRLTLPDGSFIYYNGFWSMVETPSLNVNEGMLLSITFSLDADITRYAT
jgi:hypothetical protein